MQFCAKDSCCTSPETFLRQNTRIDSRGLLVSYMPLALSQLLRKTRWLRRCSICGLLSNVRQALDRCRNRWTSFLVGEVLAGCNRCVSAASAQRV